MHVQKQLNGDLIRSELINFSFVLRFSCVLYPVMVYLPSITGLRLVNRDVMQLNIVCLFNIIKFFIYKLFSFFYYCTVYTVCYTNCDEVNVFIVIGQPQTLVWLCTQNAAFAKNIMACPIP